MIALFLADLGKRLVLPLLDGGTVVIPVNGVAVVVLPFDFELFVFALTVAPVVVVYNGKGERIDG